MLGILVHLSGILGMLICRILHEQGSLQGMNGPSEASQGSLLICRILGSLMLISGNCDAMRGSEGSQILGRMESVEVLENALILLSEGIAGI